jgi:hypothetical protein
MPVGYCALRGLREDNLDRGKITAVVQMKLYACGDQRKACVREHDRREQPVSKLVLTGVCEKSFDEDKNAIHDYQRSGIVMNRPFS